MIIDNDQKALIIQGELLRRLKKERIEQGISQVEMSEKTGLSRLAINKLENGKGARLLSFLLYLKALGKIEDLDKLFPEPSPRPSDMLSLGKERQRIAKKKHLPASGWKWGEDK